MQVTCHHNSGHGKQAHRVTHGCIAPVSVASPYVLDSEGHFLDGYCRVCGNDCGRGFTACGSACIKLERSVAALPVVTRQILLERVQYAHRLWEAGIRALELSFGSDVELDFADYDWEEVTLETLEADIDKKYGFEGSGDQFNNSGPTDQPSESGRCKFCGKTHNLDAGCAATGGANA